MSFLCPVCNGMRQLTADCPLCRRHADDCGRCNDYFGPYSPYRQIDDISMTNGFPDLADHLCVHIAACPDCSHSFHVFVKEWGIQG